MSEPRRPILFITRTYPPIIGGLEMLSYNLTTTVSKKNPSIIIKNLYGKKTLPFFIPWALLKAILILFFKKEIRVVHLSDGVLAPIGYVLKVLFPRVRTAITIHGLDLTYVENFSFYYYTNIIFIRKMDRVIAVSEETRKKCLEYGIDEQRSVVILNGTHSDQYFDKSIRKNRSETDWRKKLPAEVAKNNSFKNKFIILYLGRLAVHKGVPWFVKNVMPSLPEKAVLMIAGMGSEFEKIKHIVEEKRLEERVFLLGSVNEEAKKFLLNSSDMLIMPNIVIPGNREGFGITAIEAGSCELVPVVADIQGLKDAVKNEENGLRVPTINQKEFVKTIKRLIEHPEYKLELGRKARKYVKENFDWSVIGRKYLEEFAKLEQK